MMFLLFSAYQNYNERSQRNQTYHEIGEDIRSRVEIGNDREKILQAMVDAGAWYSTKCREIEKDVIYDYFYFGPKEKDRVFVFRTTSDYQESRYVLAAISNYSDSISIADIPDACLPPEFQ
jgi:hypothetical protein